MMLRKFKKIPRKILSASLCFAMLLSVCVIPGVIPAQALSYLYEKTYYFSEGSGIQYGDVYLEDSNGTSRQISRAFFDVSENGELEIINALEEASSGNSGYLFNDTDGLFELRASTSYTVSLRVKVVSSQKYFSSGNVTYPVSSQITELKLAYGMPAVNATNKITMDTEIGTVASIGSETSTFTANVDGEEVTYDVGKWYTLTYDFTTPDTFGENGNVLGFGLKCFSGIHILIDDVNVAMLPSITVDPGVGTISQTSFPQKIGDKINIENPTYKFGYDFEGWFTDSACTKEFTDEYVTEENCEIKLYAGWSETHFSFEGYTPIHPTFGFSDHFYDIVEDETAPDGNKVLEYHYTEEYWSQIREVDEETGAVSYYSGRRTALENNISLKYVDSYTTYVVTFKYKVTAGSGDTYIFGATSSNNIWHSGTYQEYLDSRIILTDERPDEWCEGRIVFTTGDVSKTDYVRNIGTLRFYAVNNVHTLVYLDDIRIEEAEGDSTVKLVANGGAFTDGSVSKTQKITVGDDITTLEYPVRENYDFGGWYLDAACTQPVTTEKVDSCIYLNTLYAGWSRNVGFEGYYYDLDSADRTNYLSSDVSIVKENPLKGHYSAKLINTNSNKQHVIALNPTDKNNTRYLITFNYSVINTTAPVNIKFATMGYNINNESEVKVYDEVYNVATEDSGKGYLMGAVIIDTAFASDGANRLAMLVSSETAADYTVYFDEIAVTELADDQGYVIFTDEITGEHTVSIGKTGDAVEVYEPDKAAHKFLGWYTDRAATTLYEGGRTYSETLTRLYADWAVGEGFDNYTSSDSAVTVYKENENFIISVTESTSIEIGAVESGKQYGVDFKYSLISATGNTALTVGDQSYSVTTADIDIGWQEVNLVVTASADTLYLNVTPSDTATIYLDDIIVYEITDYMAVITFDQKDGYGEDQTRIGVRGLSIKFPSVPVNGDNVFYGWYNDSALTSVYTSKVYGADDITLYARWATNPITKVTFDDLDTENLPFNENNSNTTYLYGDKKQSGTYSMAFDRQSEEEDYDTYVPLATADGLLKLQSNTTYAVSFYYYFPAYSSSSYMNFTFYTCGADAFEKTAPVSSLYRVNYATGWRQGYTYITTGDLDDTNNVLYIAITGGGKKNTLYLDTIKFTRIDEGRNHVFAYEDKGRKLYEIDGNYGEAIEFPNIDEKNYKIAGWCNDQEVTDIYEEAVHKEEEITFLYGRWELSTITFDNYLFEGSNSKYTVGDDISLSNDYAYDTVRSLKYSYNYAIKYFETANNAASMGRVNDKSTYKVSFMYKLTETQGDVDIKFLTANLTNRWAFVTNYDEATYTVHSGEVGNDWKQATVYLTTEFVHRGTSGLFFTFNPRIEGDTVLYIDSVNIEYLGTSTGVAAFIGKDGNAVMYEQAKVGSTVSAPEEIPAAQFSAFNGWYSDSELTTEFSSLTLSSGINYVYSSWTDKSETFDNYTYSSNDEKNYAQTNVIENGVLTYTADSDADCNGLRIGKVENNTSYKVTFSYKASDNATIKFATADEMDISVNATHYSDEGNFITVAAANDWNTATVYFTSSFAYTIPNDENVNVAENKNAHYGDMLYMLIDAESGVQVSIDSIALKEVNALYSAGSSVLTEEASKEAESQAMRFYFSYPTQDGITLDIDGEAFTLVERGMIFKNARNTATGVSTGDSVQVSAITLDCKDKAGHSVVSKTYKFNEYWDYDNKTESVVFSGYIKDFNMKDARLIAARGYIKVKDNNGNIYTFYSADKKATVKEGVERNSEITDVSVHTFAGVTWDKFTIVNPKLMPYIYGRQIEFLMEYAEETHGVTLSRFTEKAEETAYEIVIGDTKRDASDLVTVEDENEYVIAVRGTKLIIKGGSDLATMQGVKDFIEYLKLKDSLDCGALLNDGYTKYGKVSTTADDYKLTFNDEFESSVIDTSVWGAYNNEKYPNALSSPSQLGGKIGFYTIGDPGYTTASGQVVDSPAFVSDGNAVLTCARLNDEDFSFIRMSTFWNMIYQYGMLEFNIKLPEHPVHVSLWMNGAGTGQSKFTSIFGREARGCMTEYDLIETYGKYNYFAGNIHHWWSSTGVNDNGHLSLSGKYETGIGDKVQTYIPDSDETYLYDNYHIFTFLWENENIVFAVDGTKFYEFPCTGQYFDRMPNYIIIGAGMGNRDYGSPYDIEKHKDYYETKLDYVRLYQIENMGSILRWANNNPNYSE